MIIVSVIITKTLKTSIIEANPGNLSWASSYKNQLRRVLQLMRILAKNVENLATFATDRFVRSIGSAVQSIVISVIRLSNFFPSKLFFRFFQFKIRFVQTLGYRKIVDLFLCGKRQTLVCKKIQWLFSKFYFQTWHRVALFYIRRHSQQQQQQQSRVSAVESKKDVLSNFVFFQSQIFQLQVRSFSKFSFKLLFSWRREKNCLQDVCSQPQLRRRTPRVPPLHGVPRTWRHQLLPLLMRVPSKSWVQLHPIIPRHNSFDF